MKNADKKTGKSNRDNNVVQVSFSPEFLKRLDDAVKIKALRNRQDLMRRATEDVVEKILERAPVPAPA